MTRQTVSDLDHTTQSLPSAADQIPTASPVKAAPRPAKKIQPASAKVAAAAAADATVATAAGMDAESKLAVTDRKLQLAAATQRIANQLATAGTSRPVLITTASVSATSESVAPRKTPVRGSRVSRQGGSKTEAQATDITKSVSSLPVTNSVASVSGSSSSDNVGSVKSLVSTEGPSPASTNRRLFRQQPKKVKQLPAAMIAAEIAASLEKVRKSIKPLPAASAISEEETRRAGILAAQNQRVLNLNNPQGGSASALDQSADAQEGESLPEDSLQPGRYYSERSNRRYQYATMIMNRQVKQPMPAAALAAIAASNLEENLTFSDSPTFLPSGPRRSARSRPFVVGGRSGESSHQSASMYVSRSKMLMLRDAKRDAKRLSDVGTNDIESNPE